MIRKYVFWFLSLFLLAGIGESMAADEEWVEKEGVIREINLAERTAIISGYRYYFGTSYGFEAASIQLLQGSRASYEMLAVGMKVQFHYTPQKPWRRVLRLRQLPYDEWLDNDELPDAHPPWQSVPTY
jgi:hypothetical protein